MTRRRIALLAIPVLLVCSLVALIASGLLVVGVGPLRVNTSGPTITSGPVSIATDHSRYLATDSIRVTVANHLAVPIYVQDAKAFCSILTLEVRQAGVWTPSRAAACGCPWSCGAVHCNLLRAPRTLSIAPGSSYVATIQHNQNVPFPDGMYRLVLAYGTGTASSATATVSTDPFPIMAVLMPPSACPYPAAFASWQRPA